MPGWASEEDRNETAKLEEIAVVLDLLKPASEAIERKAELRNTFQVGNELTKGELEEIRQRNKLVQKVRICGENENLIRILTLVILVVLIVAAALATVHLHRIADYKVGPTVPQLSISCNSQHIVSEPLQFFRKHRLWGEEQ